MTPTPEQIKALYDAARAVRWAYTTNTRPDIYEKRALIKAVSSIDGGTYNPNLNFGGWLPIESAPRDKQWFAAVGQDFGEAYTAQHVAKACWNGHFFVDKDGDCLQNLTYWQPLPEIKE
jgi:hypothetical protein